MSAGATSARHLPMTGVGRVIPPDQVPDRPEHPVYPPVPYVQQSAENGPWVGHRPACDPIGEHDNPVHRRNFRLGVQHGEADCGCGGDATVRVATHKWQQTVRRKVALPHTPERLPRGPRAGGGDCKGLGREAAIVAP